MSLLKEFLFKKMLFRKRNKLKAAKLVLKQLHTLAKQNSAKADHVVLLVNPQDMNLLKSINISSEQQLNLHGIPIQLKPKGEPSISFTEVQSKAEHHLKVTFDAS